MATKVTRPEKGACCSLGQVTDEVISLLLSQTVSRGHGWDADFLTSVIYFFTDSIVLLVCFIVDLK